MHVAQTFFCTEEEIPQTLAGILFFDRLPDSADAEALYKLLKVVLTKISNTELSFNGQLICEETQMQSDKDLQSLAKISEILCDLGMPTNLLGYQYLRYAIHTAVKSPEILRAITKELYPQIAREFRTTASSVERAIRHAIEVVWDRGNIEILERYFGYTIDPNRGKPTNSEFISKIVDNLIFGKMKTAYQRETKLQMGITA